MAQEKTPTVVAVLGSNEGLVKENALAWSRKLTPNGGDDFSMEIIEGTADNAEHACSLIRETSMALETLPFFGEKTVWLKNANFLDDSVTGRAESVINELETLKKVLERGLISGVKFLLSAMDIDKRRSFYKALGKYGVVELHDLPDTSKGDWAGGMRSVVLERARQRKLTFAPDALELFISLAGAEIRIVENELEKLDLYLGLASRVIEVETVTTMVSQTHQTVIWELGNAIGQRQLKRALDCLDQLFFQKENAVGILLVAVVLKVRNLLFAKALVEETKVPVTNYNAFESALRRMPEAITGGLPQKKDGTGLNVYPLFLAAKETGAFKLEELRKALSACLAANRALVTTGTEARVVIEKLLVEIIASREQKLGGLSRSPKRTQLSTR